MADKLYLSIDRDGTTGGVQISINIEHEDGGGYGYRLAGPKFSGTSRPLLQHAITKGDAAEIRGYLDDVFPPEVRDAR